MKQNLVAPEKAEVSELMKTCEIIKIDRDFDFVEGKQIPLAGIILIEGKVEFSDGDSTESVECTCSIMGVKQLINNIEVTYGCRVKKDSQIIVLGKSEILKAMMEQDSELSKILSKFYFQHPA